MPPCVCVGKQIHHVLDEGCSIKSCQGGSSITTRGTSAFSGQIVNFPVGVAVQTFQPLWGEDTIDFRRLLRWRNAAVTKLLELRGSQAEETYDAFVHAVNAAVAGHPNGWFAKSNSPRWRALREVYAEYAPQFMAVGLDLHLCALSEERPSSGGRSYRLRGDDASGSRPRVKLTPWLEFVDTTTNPEYRPRHVWEEDLEQCPLM